MLSKESRDTENWSNGCIVQNILKYKNIVQYNTTLLNFNILLFLLIYAAHIFYIKNKFNLNMYLISIMYLLNKEKSNIKNITK